MNAFVTKTTVSWKEVYLGRPGFLGIRYIRVFNIRYTVFLCRKWGIKYYTFLNFGIKYTALKNQWAAHRSTFENFPSCLGIQSRSIYSHEV